MSASAVIVISLLAFALAAVIWQASRALRHAAEQIRHYDGPDSLRLLEDLETHMKAYGNTIADLYEPVGPAHPGLNQLRAAIRNEQTKGEK